MKRLIILVLLAVIVPCALAQAQPAQAPKPGPEVQLMAPWIGNWHCAYEGKTGAMSKSEGDLTCEWTANGFVLSCKSAETTMAAGYSPEEKAYWMFRYGGNGFADHATGWIKGTTWKAVYENERAEGKARRRQVTMSVSSPNEFTLQWDRSVEGEPWVTTQVGKCNKTK
jgi:hypothetical protein